MEQNILWSPWIGPGLEHLTIFQQSGRIVADGLIIGIKEQVPFRVRYQIRCGLQWKLQAVRLDLLNNSSSPLHLLTDGEGSWTTNRGESLPLLKGCRYVDISATPFTNTLPIRRLALSPGSSAIIPMVYIEIPQLQIEVTEQRYTCLENNPFGSRYLFESLENGVSWFKVELPVDKEGFILDYPELFRRV